VRNLYGFVVLFAASIGIAAVIYASVRKSLVDLLDEVTMLPAAATFYSRLFLICVFFMALSTAVGTTFNLKADAAVFSTPWNPALRCRGPAETVPRGSQSTACRRFERRGRLRYTL
jgi:hypothetical protein